MAATTTTFDALMRDVYTTERIQDLAGEASSVWKRIKKVNKFVERRYVIPAIYGRNEGVGPTISSITIGNTSAEDFMLTRKTLLARCQLDRELIEAMKDPASLADAIETELSGTESAFIGRLCAQLYRNGGGAIGKLDGACNVATPTLVLDNPKDAVHFHPSMVLQADTTDGNSGAVEGGTVTVKAVDPVTGTITLTGNGTAGIATLTNVMYLFPNGMFGLGAAGFEAWCPASAPGAGDSFYGVNRSVAPTELAGLRKSANGGTVEDALIDACVEMSRVGRTPKQIVLNPYRMGILLREKNSQIIYDRGAGSKGDIAMGAERLLLNVPTLKGTIELVSDHYCQSDLGWLVDLDDWSILSTPAGAPHVQKDRDGNSSFVVSDANSIEIRYASYWNIGCRRPQNVMRLAF